MDITAVAAAQLAADFDISAAELTDGKNHFVRPSENPHKRPAERGSALRILCGGGLSFDADDEALLAALEEAFAKTDGAWFLNSGSLRRLDGILAGFGQRIADFHLYYLPHEPFVTLPEPPDAVWYEDAALEAFRGDARFDEALAFSEATPDRLAVASRENGRLTGMAGASCDAETMWQIGINVEPDCRGRGLAVRLTNTLARRLLSQGIVPFYGTATSHILSQRVAAGSGFRAAWAELSVEKNGTDEPAK